MSNEHTVNVDIDLPEATVARIDNILSGIGSIHYALSYAMKRAADSGRTVAARAATKEYAVSQSTFNANITSKGRKEHIDGDGISVSITYAGTRIPLVSFDTTVSADGHVKTRAKRSSTWAILDHAFLQKMHGHTGIYERVGSKRFPIKQDYGPAPTQMMYANETVMDAVVERVEEILYARLEHEVERIFKGYGG